MTGADRQAGRWMIEACQEARLYGILDAGYVSLREMPAVAGELISGGVGMLQLRAKGEAPEAIAAVARAVHAVTCPARVPLIINDFPEVAAALGCEGVHVGQDDASVAAARAIVGPGRVVGKSTHSLRQAEAAAREGADYIGFGPLFATPTKPGRPAIGLDEIGEAHRRIAIPIFCIGGVNPDTLPSILAAGARRVVVVSALLQAADRAHCARDVLANLRCPPKDHRDTRPSPALFQRDER